MNFLKVEICFGTTCHILGGGDLLDIEEKLTDDVAPFVDISGISCLGFCTEQNFGKAPFVRIDDEVIGDMTEQKLISLITKKVNDLKAK